MDIGMSIHERDLDKIFLSFTQGNMNNAGSGLGLSITKNLVELHGGYISVSSKEGTTSTFKFTLPVSSGPSQTKKEDCVLAKNFR
jgi:signal transduction histidine kinase